MLSYPEKTSLLLDWYAKNKRSFPWRDTQDPYKIWISEVMLQQTTVSTVIPYFLRWIQVWPCRYHLAKASLDQVLTLWSGLGYYKRAFSLHRTANLLETLNDWPKTPETWEKYPGIGPYTAAAISAIAFEFPVIPIDGNVRRILFRLRSNDVSFTAKDWQQNLPNFHRWGDLAQSFMDLGSLVCRPQNPKCDICPLKSDCQYARQPFHQRPVQIQSKPIRYGQAVCLFTSQEGNRMIYMQKEKNSKLLSGLFKVPIQEVPPFEGDCIRHAFTHFIWKITIQIQHIENMHDMSNTKGIWIPFNKIPDIPISSLVKKILKKMNDILDSEKSIDRPFS